MKTSTYKFEFEGNLALAFIVLKLTKVISWSWWWVLSPILGTVVLIMIAAVLKGIVRGLKK